MKETFNEQGLESQAEQKAENLYRRFRPQMEALESSPLARLRSITPFDVVALGEQLQQFETYRQYIAEAGTASDLGKLPTIALDIITASYGASIIPLLCSVQPIEEVRGTIYFKQTRAANTRGNVTAGQLIRNPVAAPAAYPRGYAGETISASLGNTAAADLDYAGTFAAGTFPVRPNSVKINVALSTPVRIMDDGEGNLLGKGAWGTINYTTGQWTLNFNADPNATAAITATFGTDYEATGTIPKIHMITGSESVEAEIFVLGTEVGMFKAFSMKKRFGILAEEEMVTDLTNEITSEIGNTAIRRLTDAAVGNVDWSKAHASYSWFEHKQELKDKITEAESTILQNAGRGVVNTLIGAPDTCAILANLPGFNKSNISAPGPQVYGTLDGMTVIRWPEATSGKIYAIYKGTGMFDTPIVYSPYMPLFVSNTLPVPNNVLMRQGVAAVWSGLKVVVPVFCTTITVTA